MLVCYPRDAVPVHLPMAGRGAVGRQQLRFRPSCRVAIDDVVLCPDDGREYVQDHHAGGEQHDKSIHSPLRSLWPRRAVDDATDMGARGLSRYEAIQTSPIGGGEIWRVILEVRIAYRLDRASKLTAAVRTHLPVWWLPKNAARRIVIDQACTAAVLGSYWHPGFRRIGSALARLIHRIAGIRWRM